MLNYNNSHPHDLKSKTISRNASKTYFAVFHGAKIKLPNNYIKLEIKSREGPTFNVHVLRINIIINQD